MTRQCVKIKTTRSQDSLLTQKVEQSMIRKKESGQHFPVKTSTNAKTFLSDNVFGEKCDERKQMASLWGPSVNPVDCLFSAKLFMSSL